MIFLISIGFLSLFILVLGLFFYLKNREKQQGNPFSLLQQQLDGLRGELRQQAQNHLDLLQKTHQGIDTRLDNAAKFFGGMETKMGRVEEVTRQVLEVSKDISSLQQILKAPKLRGGFSEQMLGDLLSQMMPQDNFALQYTFSNGERVDAIIKTAQGMVSVDAKFPLENFQRLIEAKSDEEKDASRKKFIADVKKHIDDIAKKYILPVEGTFEFALMYIPAENVYYEIVTRDLGLQESQTMVHYAMKKHVIPVSPNTFYAYLQTILLGLRGMQVQKQVREIITEMGLLRKELTNFRVDFSKVGAHLNNATTCFNKSDNRLTRLEDRVAALDVAPSAGVDVLPTTSIESLTS